MLKYVSHLSHEVVLGRRDVDLNRRQSQTRCFLTQEVREHPIAFEQVTQGFFGVTGLREKSPGRSAAACDDGLAELGRRQKPDGMSRNGEKRLHEAWQQPESLDDHPRWQTKDVFDD